MMLIPHKIKSTVAKLKICCIICNNLLQEVAPKCWKFLQGSFPHPFWLLPCETSLQSPGMASQQPECCKLQICNNLLQEVLDMPASQWKGLFPIHSGFCHMKPHCRAQGWPASTGPAARMLQIADLQFQNAPKFANLQPYETSLQSPGPWNGQPAARMIPMHICINLLQDVLDMPARVFLPSILDSDMCYLTAEPWNHSVEWPASSQNAANCRSAIPKCSQICKSAAI